MIVALTIGFCCSFCCGFVVLPDLSVQVLVWLLVGWLLWDSLVVCLVISGGFACGCWLFYLLIKWFRLLGVMCLICVI